ncbi:MAG TPA: alpha/beta fold hydrolase [Hyphomicrobiaceae bacterium]|nr:alpha/beta fold hydrolase [Hyphomicrobiaceae bacterium]
MRGRKASRPDGPDTEHVVFVPGLLCTSLLFGPQIAALGGRAGITVADHTQAASMALIAEGVLRAAPERFALAGLSMGGYVAFEIIRQAPERVLRLALLDTNARADRPEQTADRRRLIALARAQGTRRVQELLLPRLIHPERLKDAALVASVLKMAEDTSPAAFERQQEAIVGRPDNRPLLAHIRCPTLIIVGAEDQMTPVKVAQEMRDGIAGSRLEVIADCGHLSTLERPEAVNRLIQQWLKL